MRVRAMSSTNDMTWGQNAANFLVDSPGAVAQVVLTRLKLLLGEWFLDVTVGMPWATQVLGANTGALYDQAVKNCILGTQGVTGIVAGTYSSQVNGRALSVSCTIATLYGATPIATVL